MTTTRSSFSRPLSRSLLTLALAPTAAIALWSVTVPSPGLHRLGSPRALDTDELIAMATIALRAVAVALLGYLTVVAALQVLVTLLPGGRSDRRTSRIVGVIDRITPNWMSVATVGIVTGVTLLGPVSPAAATGPTTDPVWDPPQLEPIDDPIDDPTSDRATDGPPTLDDLPPVIGQPTPTVDALVPPLVIERFPEHHVVQPGEHFWSIAEQVVADRSLAEPVGWYWRRLVDANRDRLVDPDDPDLLHPGQELVLP